MKIDLAKKFEEKFMMGIKPSIEPITMGLLGAGAIQGAGSLLGGWLGANASRDAAGIQSRSADKAMNLYRQQFGRAEGYQQPYLQAGQEALGGLRGGGFGTDVPQFEQRTFDPSQIANDPGYQFRLQQGQQGVERGAAARGGALGGRTMKDLARFSQGLASQEVGNAFNRFSQNRAFDYGAMRDRYGMQNQQQTQRYGQLSNLANMGQRAAGDLSGQATQLGGLLGGATMQQGNVNAAGRMGSANAWQNAIGGLANAFAPAAAQGMQGFGGGGGGNLGGMDYGGMPFQAPQGYGVG